MKINCNANDGNIVCVTYLERLASRTFVNKTKVTVDRASECKTYLKYQWYFSCSCLRSHVDLCHINSEAHVASQGKDVFCHGF